ncbi:MAG: NUDIX domain-containing protein [Minisyncoccia bacterium]
MTATKRLGECPNHRPGWKLLVEGKELPASEWELRSNFGAVESAVVCDDNGSPVFDRPLYREAPNVNIVVWGKTRNGETRLAIIRQPRPHADDPERPDLPRGHAPVVFGQIPMGFLEKLLGEKIESAATREAREEAGASTVISITKPKYPWQNPNPTFVGTWSDLLFVEVDLERIEAIKSTRNEPIYSAEYVTPSEIIRRVREGRDENGAVYRMCTANSILFIFFCTFPELFRA